MRRVWVCAFFILMGHSYGQGHAQSDFVIPEEFRPEEVAKEREGNRRASTGSSDVDGLHYSWGPESLVVSGNDSRKVTAEFENIRSAFMRSPVLSKLHDLMRLSPDGKSFDVSPILVAIDKMDPNQTASCFSVPMLFYGHGDFASRHEDALKNYLNEHMRPRLVAGQANGGDVVLVEDKGRRHVLVHAYLQLTPVLALEKRGSGAFLIRPSAKIEEDMNRWLGNTPDLGAGGDTIREKHRHPAKLRVFTQK